MKTWKNHPQNVYNLAAIAVALLIVLVSIRLGVVYLKYVHLSTLLVNFATLDLTEVIEAQQRALPPPYPSLVELNT